MSESLHAHVALPRALVDAVDARVGERERSRFIEEAVEARLKREQLIEVLDELEAGTGVLDPDDYPHWATPEKTSQWVHDLRRGGGEVPPETKRTAHGQAAS